MLRLSLIFALTMAPTLPLTPALAVPAGDGERPSFSRLDRDGDGVISAAEAGQNHRISRTFRAADINRDGRLDRAEFLKEIAFEATRPLQG